MDLLKALLSRRWWWVTLVVLALMLILARLGIWQLDRLAERRAANAALMVALDAPAVNLNGSLADFSTLTPDEVADEWANRNAAATGVFDFDHQVVVRLQTWNGNSGVRLVTPLLLNEETGAEEAVAVLVDRGWIPEAEYVAGNRYMTSGEPATVEGYLALSEILLRQTSGPPEVTDSGIEVYRVDIANIQTALPYRLLPLYLRQNPSVEAATTIPARTPREVDLSEGPHLGYAIQWFIFSLGLGTAYVIYVNRSLKSREANHTAPV
jgi:surfeit locus 1 family protein